MIRPSIIALFFITVSTLLRAPLTEAAEMENRGYTLDLGGVTLEMMWIGGGAFRMGSPASEASRHAHNEGPVHEVELDGFWLGKCEVTQEQYQQVMGTNPSTFKGLKNPVEHVSWDDAMLDVAPPTSPIH